MGSIISRNDDESTRSIAAQARRPESDTEAEAAAAAAASTDTAATRPRARAAAADEFRASIAGLVPIYLIDDDIRRQLRAYADWALALAADQGCAVADLRVDGTCLPCLDGNGNGNGRRAWDPEMESLHEIVQRSLREHQTAQEISPRVRELITRLGNERLREAAAVAGGGGVRVADLVMGVDLLPTWTGRGGSGLVVEVGEGEEEKEEEKEEEEEKEKEEEEEEEEEEKEKEDDDDDDEDDDDDDDEDSDNHQDQDQDASLDNIVHDVQVFGASFDGIPVDFEVYLAQDDPDMAQLPEVELSVDEDAFSSHHGLDEVVEVELSGGGGGGGGEGGGIYCQMPLSRSEEEVVGDEDEGGSGDVEMEMEMEGAGADEWVTI